MNIEELSVKGLRAVLSDLDDTLTNNGRVLTETYEALWRLKEQGFWLAIISGRPAGWSDCLMRLWPIDAMVFENGAGMMIRRADRVETISLLGTATLTTQRKRLEEIFKDLRTRIPDLHLATDQPYRLCDFAIDYAEDPPFLTATQVNWLMEELSRHADITAKLSSIHINYWCGKHTKVTACEYLIEKELKSLGIGKQEIVFSGDSPNDEPLFEFFPNSVGVANVKQFLSRMKFPPRYITSNEGGAGFTEIVKRLLSS